MHAAIIAIIYSMAGHINTEICSLSANNGVRAISPYPLSCLLSLGRSDASRCVSLC